MYDGEIAVMDITKQFIISELGREYDGRQSSGSNKLAAASSTGGERCRHTDCDFKPIGY
jgi:hypothetical protein